MVNLCDPTVLLQAR